MPSHRADTPPLTRAMVRQRERANRRVTHSRGSSSLGVSHVGIVGALGLATIAAPISGVMSVSSPAKAAVNAFDAADLSGAAQAFPFVGQVAQGVQRLSLVPDDGDGSLSIPGALAAPRDLLVTRPSRGRERAVLPGCFGEVPLGKVDNGKLPSSMLCTLWDGEHRLRSDAAVALAKLNVAYTQRFGHAMCITDGYRTLNQQYAVKARRGSFAATPGTSMHGLGRAVDLCGGIENAGSREHQWMVDNAHRYGWDNPEWSQPGGGGPREPWHWEYVADGQGGDYTGD